jgi:hypothetical protein
LTQLINKKFLVALLFATLSIIFSFLLYPDYLSDDAFIHIGFINGLMSGNGFSFAGNRTYGTTSPLWVILGSVFSFITRNPEISIRYLSGFFTFISVIAFYFLLEKLNFNNVLKALGLLSISLNPFVLRWSLTGMESTAVMFLMILFLLLLLKEESTKQQISLGCLFGISFLLRPEFIGFFILFVIYKVFKYKSDPKKIIFTLPAIIILFAWLIFAYSQFGTIIPNTYTAKSSTSLINFDIHTFFRDMQTFFVVSLPEIILIFVLILLFVIKTKKGFRRELIVGIVSRFKNVNFDIVFIWVVVFHIFYILRDITIITRYAIMFVPLITIAILFLLENIYHQINNSIKQSLFIIYLLLIIGSSVLISFGTIKPSVDDFVNGFQTTYKDIAMIINAYSTNEDVSVGVADVGIIGAYSNAKVYDSVGLVDNERFKYSSTLNYYIDKKPDFIVLRGEEKIKDVIPSETNYEILYTKSLPGFGIKDPEPRVVTLYKVSWK